MDLVKANGMLDMLLKSGVSGWRVLALIDHGKSAAVFRAMKGEKKAAIKIFDTELIRRFGGEVLLERMEREKWLLGHDHPNIVRMIESGIEPASGNHFLIMEYLDGENLSKSLSLLPFEMIGTYVEQLASAARYLEFNGLAHRDIKPANIVVCDNFQRLVLLDFGVLRPVGEQGLTDNGGTPLFVGTNQYASPEFALRQEEDNPEGWRAVTFYQIGAVIHDMIMQRPLFGNHVGVPARLAQAVQNEVPEILSTDAPPYLVTLAQACLVKSAATRLKMVSWDNFKKPVERQNRSLELRERIRQRVDAARTRESESANYEIQSHSGAERLVHSVSEIVRETLRSLGQADPSLPRRIVYVFGATGDGVRADFEPDADAGLPRGLSACLSIEVADEKSQIVGIEGGASECREEASWEPARSKVFLGAIDQKAIEEAVTLFVLDAVDRAQRAAIAGAIAAGGGD